MSVNISQKKPSPAKQLDTSDASRYIVSYINHIVLNKKNSHTSLVKLLGKNCPSMDNPEHCKIINADSFYIDI